MAMNEEIDEIETGGNPRKKRSESIRTKTRYEI